MRWIKKKFGSKTPSIDDTIDRDLVHLARQGQAQALDLLLRRHQTWIFNLAQRMLWEPLEAEDVTQEILIKVLTGLSSFQGSSSFHTWAYRIAINHLLSCRRGRVEQLITSFSQYGDALARTPDADAPENALLVEEAREGCLLGMLLCLDREQRLLFILGEIFAVGDALGSDLLAISRDNFRQKLSRTRTQLFAFMRGHCGLVEPTNPCRCARKTQGYIREGHVDPQQLRFAPVHRQRAEIMARTRQRHLARTLEQRAVALFRCRPLDQAPDLVAKISSILQEPEIKSILKFGIPSNQKDDS